MDPHRCNCLSLRLLRPTIPGISSPSATHTFTSHTVYLSTEREHATLHTSATHTFRDNSMCRGKDMRGNCTFRSATHTFARITLYRTTGRGILSLSPPRHTLLPRIPCIAAHKRDMLRSIPSATHTFRDNSMCHRGNPAHKRHIPTLLHTKIATKCIIHNGIKKYISLSYLFNIQIFVTFSLFFN